jgi:hypothetical protein
MKQDMIERITTLSRGFYEYLQVTHHIRLTGKAVKSRGPQYPFDFHFRLTQVGAAGIQVFVHVFLLEWQK